MATYYVDYINGNDANNGLGPDASHASNKPWKTITKLLGAAGMASGDTAYLSPAGQFRETVSVGMTSATVETKIIGDYANERGFKTSGGVAVLPGPVIVTAYTTNDKTAPSGTTLLNLAGRDFLTFESIMFVGGTTTLLTATTTTSTNITFTDCVLKGTSGSGTGASLISAAAAFNVPLVWRLDRCMFVSSTGTSGITFTLTTGTSPAADFDADVLIRNSLFLAVGSTRSVFVTNTGTATQKGGGVRIKNCTSLYSGTFIQTTASQISTTIPCEVYNCVLTTLGASTLLVAGTAGQLVEDYNILSSLNTRVNVSAGANSIVGDAYAVAFHFGQERIWKMMPRPFAAPTAGSPFLAFGNDGTQTSYDGLNRPRPAGGQSALPAAGWLGRGNTFVADASPIGAGGSAITITGPGYAEFLVPVPARAVTISCKVKWDGTYAGTKPQLQIDKNGRNGVAAETITATGAATNIETLTLTPFTPTKDGDMVTIRVLSNDTNGAGVLQVDDFSVSG